jgi:hypothetical protein
MMTMPSSFKAEAHQSLFPPAISRESSRDRQQIMSSKFDDEFMERISKM